MNDWWNDPPETQEPPECCEELMEQLSDGGCLCLKCGRRLAPDMATPEPSHEEERLDGVHALSERFEAQARTETKAFVSLVRAVQYALTISFVVGVWVAWSSSWFKLAISAWLIVQARNVVRLATEEARWGK